MHKGPLKTYRIEWEPRENSAAWITEAEFSNDDQAKCWHMMIMERQECRMYANATLLWRIEEDKPSVLSRLVYRRSATRIEETLGTEDILNAAGLKPLRARGVKGSVLGITTFRTNDNG